MTLATLPNRVRFPEKVLVRASNIHTNFGLLICTTQWLTMSTKGTLEKRLLPIIVAMHICIMLTRRTCVPSELIKVSSRRRSALTKPATTTNSPAKNKSRDQSIASSALRGGRFAQTSSNAAAVTAAMSSGEPTRKGYGKSAEYTYAFNGQRLLDFYLRRRRLPPIYGCSCERPPVKQLEHQPVKGEANQTDGGPCAAQKPTSPSLKHGR